MELDGKTLWSRFLSEGITLEKVKRFRLHMRRDDSRTILGASLMEYDVSSNLCYGSDRIAYDEKLETCISVKSPVSINEVRSSHLHHFQRTRSLTVTS